MKLILSDQKTIRIFEQSPAPVEQILLEQGINPLEVIVSPERENDIRGYGYSGE